MGKSRRGFGSAKSFDELINMPARPAAYIEPAFLPKSSKIIMGGPSKTGKSFLSAELARALTTGTPVFGNPAFVVPQPVSVLLLDKELGYSTLGKRLQTLYADSRPVAPLHAVSGEPDFFLDDEACWPNIRRFLVDKQPNVLIVDPASKFMSGADTCVENIRTFLHFCDNLIEEFEGTTQLSIVVTHHFKLPNYDRNGEAIEPLSPYNFRGGSKWYDDMDSLITAQRHDVSDDHWRIQCEPEFRHGVSPAQFWLDVYPEKRGDVVAMYHPTDREVKKLAAPKGGSLASRGGMGKR